MLGRPFIWLGVVFGISVIETPLTFTAPGITVPLGLGTDRLASCVRNGVEPVVACVLRLGSVEQSSS